MTDRDGVKHGVAGVLAYLEGVAGSEFGSEVIGSTPERWLAFLESFLTGYTEPLPEPARYEVPEAGPVRVEAIRFYSLCEHHLLPFFGSVSIEYHPSGLVIGISDLVRVVTRHAARLQLQERMTLAIAEDVWQLTRAEQVVVRAEAEHLCMAMRGVRAPDALVVTEARRPTR